MGFSLMTPFIIGAGIGVARCLFYMASHSGGVHYPIQGLPANAAIGFLIYGSILWVLALIFLK